MKFKNTQISHVLLTHQHIVYKVWKPECPGFFQEAVELSFYCREKPLRYCIRCMIDCISLHLIAHFVQSHALSPASWDAARGCMYVPTLVCMYYVGLYCVIELFPALLLQDFCILAYVRRHGISWG